jgi:hypothetical protein
MGVPQSIIQVMDDHDLVKPMVTWSIQHDLGNLQIVTILTSSSSD